MLYYLDEYRLRKKAAGQLLEENQEFSQGKEADVMKDEPEKRLKEPQQDVRVEYTSWLKPTEPGKVEFLKVTSCQRRTRWHASP